MADDRVRSIARGATEWEREAVEDILFQAFEGRKGHGGGPCTRRVLRERDLRAYLLAALVQYRHIQKRREAEPRIICQGYGGVVTRFAARHGFRKCAEADCPNPVDINGRDGSDGVRCPDHN